MNHVQSLESRQLLSATLAAGAKPKPTPKPVIPSIVGKYAGTVTTQKPIIKPATFSFDIKVASETTTGTFSGSDASDGDPSSPLKGAVTANDQFTFTSVVSGNRTVTATGAYQPSTHAISGKFSIAAGKGKAAESGVFSVELVK